MSICLEKLLEGGSSAQQHEKQSAAELIGIRFKTRFNVAMDPSIVQRQFMDFNFYLKTFITMSVIGNL